MFIKKIFTFLLIFSLTFNLLANEMTVEQMLSSKAETLNGLLNNFSKLCINGQNEILHNTVVVNQEKLGMNSFGLNCDEEEERLALMVKDLNKEVAFHEKQIKKDESNFCEKNNLLAQPLDKSQTGFLALSKKASDVLSKDECKAQSGIECFGDVACNVLKSSVLLPVANLLSITNAIKKDSCLSNSSGSCLTEMVAGVIKDVFSNMEGIWDMAKSAYKGTKNAVVSSWKFFTSVENKTSDAALMASVQTDSFFQKFKKDPVGFIKEMAQSLTVMINDSIKNNFGCESWSGAPHVSTCVKPMTNWNCANCNQKLNAACGVAGALGGEVIVAFFTGGAVNALSKFGGKGALAFLKAHEALTKAVPAISKVEAVASSSAHYLALPIKASLDSLKKVLNSEMATKILKDLKQKKEQIALGAGKFSNNKTLTVSLKVFKGAVSPIVAYAKLLDKSFMLGMKQSNKLIGGPNSLRLMSEKTSSPIMMEQTDSILIATDKEALGDIDLYKQKLTEEKIEYTVEKLSDGRDAVKIKIDPACKIPGK